MEKKLLLNDAQLEVLADWLDRRFILPGLPFRFGLDGLLGLLPIVGDSATLLLSLLLIAEAARRGVRKRALVRMAGYAAADFLIGSVPVVGDLLDFGFKSNSKILEHLRYEQSLQRG